MIFTPVLVVLAGLAASEAALNEHYSLPGHMRIIRRREIAKGEGSLAGEGTGVLTSKFTLGKDGLKGDVQGTGNYKGVAKGHAKLSLGGLELETEGEALAKGRDAVKGHGEISGLNTGFNVDAAHEGKLDAQVVGGADMYGLQVAGGSAKLEAGYGQKINAVGGVGRGGLFGTELTSQTQGGYKTAGRGGIGVGSFEMGGKFEGQGNAEENSKYSIGLGVDNEGINLSGGGETKVTGAGDLKGVGGIGGEYMNREHWKQHNNDNAVKRRKREIAKGEGSLAGKGTGVLTSKFTLGKGGLIGDVQSTGNYEGVAKGDAKLSLGGLALETGGQALASGSGAVKGHGEISGLNTGFNVDAAHEGKLDAQIVGGADMYGLQVAGGSAKLEAGYGQKINAVGGVGRGGLLGTELTSQTQGGYNTAGRGGIGVGSFGMGGKFEGQGNAEENSKYSIGLGVDKEGINLSGGGETKVTGAGDLKGVGGVGSEFLNKDHWNKQD